MSQQQAVQPIVLKQENGEVVLKLVLENPKQDTQTLILQQPDGKEFTMSTDKTAIAAFDYATGIAVFLALCATGLAYWYGVRSFHLTKQSFDALVKQIDSSDRSSLDLNQKMFEQSMHLRNLENDLKNQEIIKDQFRKNALNFIVHSELFLTYIVFVYTRNSGINFNKKVQIGSYEHEIFLGIQSKLDNMFEARSYLVFSALEVSLETHDQVDQLTFEVVDSMMSIQNKLIDNKDEILNEIGRSKILISNLKKKLYYILEKKAA